MTGLQTNLQKLSASRLAARERRSNTRSQLAEFLDMRIKKAEPPTPVGGTPVAPGAVERRMASAPVAPGKHSMNDGHGHSSQAEVKGLNKDFERALNQLIKDSGGRIKITSGYRDPERQAELFRDAVKKYGSEKAARKWVAPPGKSNHNHGLAADISGDRAWAHKNAAKYGLVFPMAHEPWHIEPINARAKRK